MRSQAILALAAALYGLGYVLFPTHQMGQSSSI